MMLPLLAAAVLYMRDRQLVAAQGSPADDLPPITPLVLPPRAQAAARAGRLVIVTTLGPSRLDAQRAAVQSWLDAGAAVVSMGAPTDLPIEYVMPARDGKERFGKPVPYIYDAVAMLAAVGVRSAALVNDDIVIAPDAMRRLATMARDGLVACSRVNMTFGQDCIYAADAFFFDPVATFPALDPLPFAFGVPCWDQWLPFSALYAGQRVRIAEGAIGHRDHPQAWSRSAVASRAMAQFWTRRMPPDVRRRFASGLQDDPYGHHAQWTQWFELPRVIL